MPLRASIAATSRPSRSDMNLIFGSVTSGIEAASVAWGPLGWKAAFVAEIEPFPCHLLHHHYGAGRPHHMPDPTDAGLTLEERDARLLAADGPRYKSIGNSWAVPVVTWIGTRIEAVEAVLKFNRAVGGLTSLEM